MSEIFQPLRVKNLTVKNRIFRSNIAGRFDNYDGSGTQTRINRGVKFATGSSRISVPLKVTCQSRSTGYGSGGQQACVARVHEDAITKPVIAVRLRRRVEQE